MTIKGIASKVADKVLLSKAEVEFLCRSKSKKADELLRDMKYIGSGPNDVYAYYADIQAELGQVASGRWAGINRARRR